jgi:hypothetical protein
VTTIKDIAQEAMLVQDACNLSGVVHSFSRMMEVIWQEARDKGEGTSYVNTHPIVKIMLDKLVMLAFENYHNSSKEVMDAFDKVRQLAADEAASQEENTNG